MVSQGCVRDDKKAAQPATWKGINAIDSVALEPLFAKSPQTRSTRRLSPPAWVRLLWGRAMAEWDWVKAIGRKLRQDLGDFHAMPREMLNLLARLRELSEDCEKSAALAATEPRGDHAGGPQSPSSGIADKGRSSPV